MYSGPTITLSPPRCFLFSSSRPILSFCALPLFVPTSYFCPPYVCCPFSLFVYDPHHSVPYYSPASLLLSLSFCLSVLSFCLDSRWGLHAERVALGKGQTYARSVPGLNLLQAADRALTSFHLTSDLLVADVSITQGRHYWACSVEPGSYLVKVSSQQIGQHRLY